MRHANRPANPLTRLLSWLVAVCATILVGLVMAAPYFVSVIANFGRRPVIYRRTPAPRRRLASARRSAA
jgi:hypothetical protein